MNEEVKAGDQKLDVEENEILNLFTCNYSADCTTAKVEGANSHITKASSRLSYRFAFDE